MQADDTTIKRTWYPYARVAREYLGISPAILRAAINRHELPAYAKPQTSSTTKGKNHSYFVNLADVDEYIRTHWSQPERIY